MSNINQIYEKYSNSKISANIKYDTSTIEKEDINIIKNLNKENYISKKLKIRPYINVEKDKSCCIEVNPEKGN